MDSPSAAEQQSCALSDALRALGFWLEPGGVHQVWLTVAEVGIGVRTAVEPQCRWYRWHDLATQNRAQARHRRRRPGLPPDPRTQLRWSGLLRTIGQLLEAQAMRACEIEASLSAPGPRQDFQVRVTVEDRVVLETEIVRQELLRLYQRYTATHAQQSGSRRRWWALWND